ncbi:MAG TPA: hypothetical protein VGB37_09760, partial [Candidatus Lokiarchaeia archaeon]
MNFKQQEKARWDKEQSRLSKNGCVPNPFKMAEKDYSIFDFNKKVLCPFCLEYNELFRFVKKRGFFICP